ncbi:MAG: DUF983 domain-containing protein [Pacificimonas sp.]
MVADAPETQKPEISPLAALAGKCPRCRDGGLYRQLVVIRDACPVCALDLTRFNVGDGATVFLIFLLNIVGLVGAVMFEFAVSPPYWVHVVIWPPILFVLTILGLRAAKGLLLALEYRHSGGQGGLNG